MDTEKNTQTLETALIIVSISEDKKRAFVTLMGPKNDQPITAPQIMETLSASGVIHGINMDMVNYVAKRQQYKKQELVASATPAVDGTDAHINYLFPLTSDSKPVELANGSVDFKNLGLIKNVIAGEPLCDKIPPTAGSPGINVLGGVIEPRPGKDYPLPIGQNTMESPDGLSILAKINGQVDLVNNRVTVMNAFNIPENVDYNTGNIDFVGNVTIGGDVITGFTVKAAGNVHIKGCVDGGIVEAGGNVTILNGVNGQTNGKIVCEGDLRCKYLQNANVDVGGNVETTSCVNSIVHAGNNAKFMGSDAKLLSSRVTAGHMVEAANIGSRSSSAASIIEVGVNPHISRRAKQIPAEINQINKNLENIERIITLYKQLEAANRLDEQKKAELIKLSATDENLKKELPRLENEKEDVDESLKNLGYGTVKAFGTIYSGTQIIIGTEKKVLNSDYQFTQFVRTPDGISTSPAQR